MSTPTALDAGLTAFLASDPAAMASPYLLFGQLRDYAPVHHHEPSGALFVSSHAEVKRGLFDVDRLSNRGYAEGTRAERTRAALPEDDRTLLDDVNGFELKMVSRSDGDQHQRLRRIAHRAFTPRRIAHLEEATERFTAELLDALPAAGSDDVVELMSGLASKLPMMVIIEMLGVPPGDRDLIRHWADTIAKNRAGTDAEALRSAHRAVREFREYIVERVSGPRAEDTDTELADALLDARDGERLTEDELVAMFVVLLFAGSETTTNLIGIGLWGLLEAREPWRDLTDDAGLIPRAVDELLRWVSPVQYLMRVAKTPLRLGEVDVPAGTSVLLGLAAANHDPAVFDEPDAIDIHRTDNPHVALAIGPHFCLGAALARLEAQIVLRALAGRYPDLALASHSPVFGGNAMLRGLQSLPVTLGASR